MRTLATLVAFAAIAAPVSAAMDHAGHADGTALTAVSIGYASYSPATVTVVTGDRLRFTNNSLRTHTATADDQSFDSGRIVSGATFDLPTRTPGTIPYHCTLHGGINGTIDVRSIVLAPPGAAASSGRAFPLRGRTALPAGTPLTVQAASGAGYLDISTATVKGDGSFDALLMPTATATYRAVAGEETSNAVRLLVLDRSVALAARRAGGRDTLTATVTPAAPGALVVLQLRLPDRFGWWPVQRAKLDARSRAVFQLHTRRRLPARVRLTLPDGATPLAQSRIVHVGAVRRKPAPAAHSH